METIGIHLYTDSLDPLTCRVTALEVYQPGQSKTFKEDVLDYLRHVARNYKVVGHGLYFQALVARRFDIELIPAADSYLLFCQTPLSSREQDRDLLTLCLRTMAVNPTQIAIRTKAELTYRLADRILTKYPDLAQAHADEMAILPVVVNMAYRGVAVDDGMAHIKDILAAVIAEKEAGLAETVGHRVNVRSAGDLEEVCKLEGLTLPALEPGKKKRSFCRDTLQAYLPNQTIEAVLELRALKYLESNYEKQIGQFVRGGRIYPQYDQLGFAGSVRYSVKQPSERAFLPPVRDLIKPDAGGSFVSVAWDGADIGVLAQLAGEEDLVSAYRQGRHPIAAIALDLYKISISQLTPALFDRAAVLARGIFFNRPLDIRALFDCDEIQAAKIRMDFEGRYKNIMAYKRRVEEKYQYSGEYVYISGYARRDRESDYKPQDWLRRRDRVLARIIGGNVAVIVKATLVHQAFIPALLMDDHLIIDVPVGTDFEDLEAGVRQAFFYRTDGDPIIMQVAMQQGDTWQSSIS